MAKATLVQGNCVDHMRSMDENSIDAIVTDPPYALSFMAKSWDTFKNPKAFQEWTEEWATEALRVLKPGGHMLSFGGTRTAHRMVSGIEDAGFEVRDTIMWLYGTGFPKSLDISKVIDKQLGAKRKIVGSTRAALPSGANKFISTTPKTVVPVTIPKTDLAQQWDGWGTALKPSFEPITLARKPLIGTVVKNVLEYGTGGINIDACRIMGTPWKDLNTTGLASVKFFSKGDTPVIHKEPHSLGRWPANTIFSHTDECQLVGTDEVKARVINRWNDGAKPFGGGAGHEFTSHKFGDKNGMEQVEVWECSEDCPVRMLNEQSGATASRFFYCSKANKKERNAGVADANNHATVKPIEIMRYLVRLITPPGGIVLDPFMGSGTTLIACLHEGFDSIGIELEEDHMRIAEQRVAYWREQIYGKE